VSTLPNIAAERLHRLASTIVRATGSGEDEAKAVADHLVVSNLTGHDSHGVGMLPDYVKNFRAGLLVPNQSLKVLRDVGAVLLLDAGRGFGQTMARDAMKLGAERAKKLGCAVVGLRNSCHVGRIGFWAEQCAAEGLVSLHFVNVADHDPLQAPFGCSDARLGTNPFCIAVPGADGKPMLLLDMATSAIAFGKARVARNKGVPVPEGVLIDAEGRPTTDPTTYVDTRKGALLSFGLHKGSGLAIFCEIMGAALIGGQTIAPHHQREDGIVNSMFSLLVDPAVFGDLAQMRQEVQAVIDWVKASPPAPGFDAVMMPGDPENRARATRSQEGVPIDPKSLGDIVAAGVSLGLSEADLRQIVEG
jgi:uncharacterized oxidoreductase